MFKWVLNLHTFYPDLKDLVDYVLFRTGDYKLRDTFDCNCFFETEFRGHVNIFDQARKSLQYAKNGDVLIVPDKLYQKDATIERITEWLDFMKSRNFGDLNLKVLMPIQGSNERELQECFEYYHDNFKPDIYGLSVYACLKAFGKSQHTIMAQKFIDRNEIKPLHLLGWSFTTIGYGPLFDRCYSVDSQALFPILSKSKYYVNEHLGHSGFDHNSTSLHKRTRITFENSINYWKKREARLQKGFGQ